MVQGRIGAESDPETAVDAENFGGNMLRPRIAISACLLGHRVRYDGGHKTDGWIVETLGRRVDWIPICPEIEAGLGLPREPIDLFRDATDAATHVIGSKSGRDFTSALREASLRLLEQVTRADGHILKSRSPSCGRGDAPITGGTTDGVYAAALRLRYPDQPAVTEVELTDPAIRARFLAQVVTRARARGAASGEEPVELPANWAE
jgi:uncharacterized protein YbbK (DUF523 family)